MDFPFLEAIVVAVASGAIYGLIKTLAEMAFPERFGLEQDWYKE